MKQKKGFETWYFNLVNKTQTLILEFIVSFYKDEIHQEVHLTIDSNEKKYRRKIKFKEEQFSTSKTSVQIGASQLGSEGMILQIEEDELDIKGEVRFAEQITLKQSAMHSGLMGPFKYLPFLHSYHEVIALTHTLAGEICINGEVIDFTGGKGYIDKEWGKAYPNVWIWAQCNQFKQSDMAMMLGVMRHQLFLDYQTSFVVPIYYQGQLEVFANYNGGHIAKLYRYKGYIHIVITQKNKLLDLKIYGQDEVDLAMSRNAHMIKDVYNCMNAKIEVKLTQNGMVLLEKTGYDVQLEIGGNTSKLK